MHPQSTQRKPRVIRLCPQCGDAFHTWASRPHTYCSRPSADKAKHITPERFWPRLDYPDGPDGCWLWRGTCGANGYGHISVGGSPRGAHRMAYTFAYGDIPDGLWVLHRCDTPACCNPTHLFLGTVADNNSDKHQKGRDARGEDHGSRTHPTRLARGLRHGSHTHPESKPRGSRHKRAVLTEAQVREARTLYDAGCMTSPTRRNKRTTAALVAPVAAAIPAPTPPVEDTPLVEEMPAHAAEEMPAHGNDEGAVAVMFAPPTKAATSRTKAPTKSRKPRATVPDKGPVAAARKDV